MNSRITELLDRMKTLENELEQEIDKARESLLYRLENNKVRFEQEVLQQQRRFKVNFFLYAFLPKPRHVLVAPFIYILLPVLLLLDLLTSLYHAICFPLLGIPKVKRSDYLIFDRQHLVYLNLLEMVNCAYCSYGNGLLAYLTEIVARTEQYWCPIKHAGKYIGAHSRYARFIEFGDAEGFRRDLEKVRKDFDE